MSKTARKKLVASMQEDLRSAKAIVGFGDALSAVLKMNGIKSPEDATSFIFTKNDLVYLRSGFRSGFDFEPRTMNEFNAMDVLDEMVSYDKLGFEAVESYFNRARTVLMKPLSCA